MSAPATVHTRTSVRPLGGRKTNLVSIRDSGRKQVEFRIQLEIWLDENAAQQVEAAVMQGGDRSTTLEVAERLIQEAAARVSPTKEFLEIIHIAFKDQLNPDPT